MIGKNSVKNHYLKKKNMEDNTDVDYAHAKRVRNKKIRKMS